MGFCYKHYTRFSSSYESGHNKFISKHFPRMSEIISDLQLEAASASASATPGAAAHFGRFQVAAQAFAEAGDSDEEGIAFRGIRDVVGQMADELQATSEELAASKQARDALQLQVEAAMAGPAATEKSTVLVSSGLQPLPAIDKTLFRDIPNSVDLTAAIYKAVEARWRNRLEIARLGGNADPTFRVGDFFAMEVSTDMAMFLNFYKSDFRADWGAAKPSELMVALNEIKLALQPPDIKTDRSVYQAWVRFLEQVNMVNYFDAVRKLRDEVDTCMESAAASHQGPVFAARIIKELLMSELTHQWGDSTTVWRKEVSAALAQRVADQPCTGPEDTLSSLFLGQQVLSVLHGVIDPKVRSTLADHGRVFAQSVFESKVGLKPVKWPDCLEKASEPTSKKASGQPCGHCGGQHQSSKCHFINHATGAQKHPNALATVGDIPFAEVPQSVRYLDLLTIKLREKNPSTGRAKYLSSVYHMIDGVLVFVPERDRVRMDSPQKKSSPSTPGPSAGKGGQKRKFSGDDTTPAPAGANPGKMPDFCGECNSTSASNSRSCEDTVILTFSSQTDISRGRTPAVGATPLTVRLAAEAGASGVATAPATDLATAAGAALTSATTDEEWGPMAPAVGAGKRKRKQRSTVEARTLIDSGALHGNFVSSTFAAELREIGVVFTQHRQKLCGFDGRCTAETCGSAEISVSFRHADQPSKLERILLTVFVVKGLAYDCIIGRPTIRQHKLITKLGVENDICSPHASGQCCNTCCAHTACVCNLCSCRETESEEIDTDAAVLAPPFAASVAAVAIGSTASSRMIANTAAKTSILGMFQQQLFDLEQGKTVYFYNPETWVKAAEKGDTAQLIARISAMETRDEARRSTAFRLGRIKGEVASPVLLPDVQLKLAFIEHDTISKEKIFFYDPEELAGEHDPFGNTEDEPWADREGRPATQPTDVKDMQLDPTLVPRWHSMCQRYKDTLTDEVAAEPARLEPFVLTIDEAKWKDKSNRRPCRPQSWENDEQINKQIQSMIPLGVVEPSNGYFYSHPHMVKKKEGAKKRFTVDFRALNDCCEGLSWPIPNMELLLERIGRQSPNNKFFAIIDLTSGYHQLEIDEKSREYTSFLTRFGLFQWKRLPMGLKAAASWFQKQMATKVLGDLLYKICELYIDDIIIFAATQEELLDRVEQVFARLEQFNVKANPKKILIGLTEIEYVGRVLSESGIEMSEARKKDIWEIAEPSTQRGLKSFLGMTGYFRQFIPGYTELEHPLLQMVSPYVKGKAVLWDDQSRPAFAAMKRAVLDSQKLYFIDEQLHNSEIVLQTDASKRGIGAYLLQRYTDADGNRCEHPVKILSRAFRGSELNWSTVEQEGFAIYFACKRWYPLLGGRRFTIETDHANLLYISDATSAKVIKWKLAIAELDFVLRHIPGVSNVVADDASRLCSVSGLENPSSLCALCSEGDNSEACYKRFSLFSRKQNRIVTKWLRLADTNPAFEYVVREPCYNGTCEHEPSAVVETEPSRPSKWLASMQFADEVEEDSMPDSDPLLEQYLPRLDDIPELPFFAVEAFVGAFHPEVEVLPEVRAVFRSVHNNISGHFGVEKSIRKIELDLDSRGFAHPAHLRAQIRNLVASCPFCQKMSFIKPAVHTRNFTMAAAYPFQRLSVDTLGPFEADEDGNKYILVTIDDFTRFVTLHAIKDEKAVTAVRSLVQYLGVFPTPQQLLSDNGPQYAARLVKELVSMIGSQQLTIHPGSHEENSLVERANKEVLRHLIGLTLDSRLRGNWSAILPMVSRIINNEVHSSTGVSPNQLVFGLMANRLEDVLLYPFNRSDVVVGSDKLLAWSSKMLALQQRVIEVATEQQRIKDAHHMRTDSLSQEITEFPLNSYVVVHFGLDATDRPASKLHTPYKGPLQVVGVNASKTVYTCRSLVTGLLEDHHVRVLKPFIVDEGVDPARVAISDTTDMEVIDYIIEHQGVSKNANKKVRLSAVKFLVQFADGKRPRWVPHKDLISTAALHAYLIEHGLGHIIKERFREGNSAGGNGEEGVT